MELVSASTHEQAAAHLRAAGLRATTQRLAVLKVLGASTRPLSVAEVVEGVQGCRVDRVTVYRNLIRLTESNCVRALPRSNGVAHYMIREKSDRCFEGLQFQCRDCGELSRLTIQLGVTRLPPSWRAAVAAGEVYAFGTCPKCRFNSNSSKVQF